MKKIISMLFCMTNIYCSIENLCDNDLSQNPIDEQKSEKIYYPDEVFKIDAKTLQDMHLENTYFIDNLIQNYYSINDNLKMLEDNLKLVVRAITKYETKKDELEEDIISQKSLDDELYAKQAVQKLQNFINDNKPYIDVLYQKQYDIEIMIHGEKDVFRQGTIQPIMTDLLQPVLANSVNVAHFSNN